MDSVKGPPFRLLQDEVKGWCAQLLQGSADAMPHATDLPSITDEQASTIEILAIVSGAVVLNKPCGISTESIVEWLQATPPDAVQREITRLQEQRAAYLLTRGLQEQQSTYTLESVSRLDKPTSGVLIVPLSRDAASRLTDQWKGRTVEKTYLCLCAGVVPLRGEMDARLR